LQIATITEDRLQIFIRFSWTCYFCN